MSVRKSKLKSSKKTAKKKLVKKVAKITKKKLTSYTQINIEGECCPRLKPTQWILRKLDWKNKPFYKKKIRLFFHMPLGMQAKVKNVMKEIQKNQSIRLILEKIYPKLSLNRKKLIRRLILYGRIEKSLQLIN